VAALGLGACAPQQALKPEPIQAASLSERRLDPQEREGILRQIQTAPLSAEAARGMYVLGLDQAANGDWKGAGAQWQKVLKEHAGSGWDRLAQFKMAQALEQLGDPARAFVQYQGLLSGTAVADLPERSRAACQRLGANLDADSLRALLAYPAADEFQPALRLRLLGLDLDAGRLDQVRSGVADYQRLFPSGPDLDKLAAIVKRLEGTVPVDKHKIGLLLPLSGPLAEFGAQEKRGIDLALKEANAGRTDADQWKLVVVDEAGSTSAAVAGLQHLVEQDQVIGVLGPLSSDVAAAAAPFLAQQRVPMLSPSAARPDLANVSPWFFRNCLTPEKQGASMADYALLDMKLTRVASVASDKAYSQTLARAFAARFTELGGQVVAQVTYTAGSNDFRGAMLALGGLDPANAKNAEQDEKREELASVEESSNALGRYLLEEAQKQVLPQGVTVTPPLKVLVIDMAQDDATRALNAGRAFSDRYARTLAQLDQLDIIGPQQAEKVLHDKGLDADKLTLQQLADLGHAVGAGYVIGGGAAEVLPDDKAWAAAIARGGEDAASARKEMGRYTHDRWFNLVAEVVETATAEVVATRRFQFSKYKLPPANPLGLQAIYLPAPASDVAQAVPNFRFYDLKTVLLGSDLWDQPELARHLEDLEGACFTTGFWPQSSRSEVQRFTQAYKLAYAAEPGLLSAQAYDAAHLMLDALSRGASDRGALRDALAASDAEAVSGRTTFAGKQDAQKRLPIIEVKDGQLKEIAPK
jgi:ABC-type branched-subunit amino acid transport system substrate-binding protein